MHPNRYLNNRTRGRGSNCLKNMPQLRRIFTLQHNSHYLPVLSMPESPSWTFIFLGQHFTYSLRSYIVYCNNCYQTNTSYMLKIAVFRHFALCNLVEIYLLYDGSNNTFETSFIFYHIKWHTIPEGTRIAFCTCLETLNPF